MRQQETADFKNHTHIHTQKKNQNKKITITMINYIYNLLL